MSEPLRVWVDQDLCTGDGLCVQYAPEVFEFDVDGLAYVKTDGGELMLAPGARTDGPSHLRLEVIDAAKECPGDCIHVVRASDDVEAAAPGRAGTSACGTPSPCHRISRAPSQIPTSCHTPLTSLTNRSSVNPSTAAPASTPVRASNATSGSRR